MLKTCSACQQKVLALSSCADEVNKASNSLGPDEVEMLAFFGKTLRQGHPGSLRQAQLAAWRQDQAEKELNAYVKTATFKGQYISLNEPRFFPPLQGSWLERPLQFQQICHID